MFNYRNTLIFTPPPTLLVPLCRVWVFRTCNPCLRAIEALCKGSNGTATLYALD